MKNLLISRNFKPLLKELLLKEAHRLYNEKQGKTDTAAFTLRRNLAADVAMNANIFATKFADNLAIVDNLSTFLDIETKKEKRKTHKLVEGLWQQVEVDNTYFMLKYKGKNTIEKDLTKEIAKLWDLLAGITE